VTRDKFVTLSLDAMPLTLGLNTRGRANARVAPSQSLIHSKQKSPANRPGF
jgi:hypothetical protein